ncbi:MAG: amidase [Croceitalea sp.]|nr:amidase [Croceitalea sp.]
MAKSAYSFKLITLVILVSFIVLHSCKEASKAKEDPVVELWTPYNDSSEVAANADNEKIRLRYKFIQSKVLDKNEVFVPLYAEVTKFTKESYETMKPLVLEQDIPTIQRHIKNRKFSYEDLVLFFLHRIYKYELPNQKTLNTVLALNPKVLEEARKLDATAEGHHSIYGMPILLKDNIGTKEMKTTAGSIALIDNHTDDAFIVKRLKEKGALILGKVNLSEWANYLCDGCPNGQSAVGGQTLNPYGRRVFDTGGSSAGSGTSIAANYAIGAVGTETSGSILSPSSQNSIVGMKPTIGLLSRTGIVPISSTLDTPGPMTKNVIDNAIILDAMVGFDEQDSRSIQNVKAINLNDLENTSLKGRRLGAFKKYMDSDSIYKATITKIKAAGATIIEFEPPKVTFEGFLSILNLDMRNDLPKYLSTQVKNKDAVKVESFKDLVAFNRQDSLVRIPYGQARFSGVLSDSTSAEELKQIKKRLKSTGRNYFDTPMQRHRLDAVLSINNYDAGVAAVAEYPALTVPMGYKRSGEPIGITFIGKQFQEATLYELSSGFEALTQARRMPEDYVN